MYRTQCRQTHCLYLVDLYHMHEECRGPIPTPEPTRGDVINKHNIKPVHNIQKTLCKYVGKLFLVWTKHMHSRCVIVHVLSDLIQARDHCCIIVILQRYESDFKISKILLSYKLYDVFTFVKSMLPTICILVCNSHMIKNTQSKIIINNILFQNTNHIYIFEHM